MDGGAGGAFADEKCHAEDADCIWGWSSAFPGPPLSVILT